MATAPQIKPQNATPHGLSCHTFTLLPHESMEDFKKFTAALEQEFSPTTLTEDFLVMEMARAQWKLDRIDIIEAHILTNASESSQEDTDPWVLLARRFRGSTSDVVLKLERYATSARRAWHKAFDTLQKLRTAEKLAGQRENRIERNLTEADINRTIAAPIPGCPPEPETLPPAVTPFCKTKPMPAHLERELAAHQRRDPLFDPRMDSSQMSRELRRWFERAA